MILDSPEGGARVIKEPHRGFGAACLAGIKALNKPEIVVFLDGDFSDSPEEMSFLVDPIIRGKADLVIGSRVLGRRQPGALSPQARFGNWLSCLLIRLIWGFRFTDLRPFRAIRYPALLTLDLQDRDYGWTVEMQIKAISHKLQVIAFAKRASCKSVFPPGFHQSTLRESGSTGFQPVLKKGLNFKDIILIL